jgi:hypothetical protein
MLWGQTSHPTGAQHALRAATPVRLELRLEAENYF